MILRTGLRYLLRRPVQSLLCVFGVALGVAVVIAIDMANSSASRAFSLSTDAVSGKTTHQVFGGALGLDEDVYRKVKVDLGIQNAAPVIDGYATAMELDAQPLRILGVDLFADPPFRNYLITAGVQQDLAGFTDFLTSPDTILISATTAKSYGLHVGSQLTLRVGSLRRTMRLVGLLQPGDSNSESILDNLGIMDISSAQELFAMNGKISHIDLIADERTLAGRELLERVRSVLPADAQLIKPQIRNQSIESLTDAFELNLTALSLLAMVVGMFLIYNTITFSVVQRRPVFGILRCLGVTGGEIFRAVLVETLVLASIGTLLGLGLGVVLGRGAVTLVTQTINDLYYVVSVRSVTVEPTTILKGTLLGIGAALTASLAPAFEATNIPPINVLRRSSIEGRVRKLLPYIAITGCALSIIGAFMLLLSHILVINLGGIFGVVVGLAIVSPLLTVWLMDLLTPAMTRWSGVIGRLAVRGVISAISRTSIAIASLMIAVSVIIGLQSMIGSFRLTVENWLDTTLIADVYLSPPASGVNNSNNVLDSNLVDQVKAFPGIRAVTTLRRIPVQFSVGDPVQGSDRDTEWKPAGLLVVQAETDRQAASFVWTARDKNQVWRDMLDHDEVQVSEPFANRYGITPEKNKINIQTSKGIRTFLVVAVYYDYSADQGVILMRRDRYDLYWDDPRITSLAVYLDTTSQQNGGQVAIAMRKQFAGRDVVVSANRELRNTALAVFDRTFVITGALNLLAMFVAFIGVLSALMALQIERTRELGMLRANGMTLGQMARMILIETGLMGGTAGLLSMPTGFLLAVILIYIINLRSFGWTIRMDLQWTTFVQAMLIAVLSALLASIYPIIRMAKLPISAAVRQE